MSNESSSRGQTWVSILALLTALVSLLVALLPLANDFLRTFAERREVEKLMSYTPATIRSTCSADTSDSFRDALAALECYPEGFVIFRLATYKDTKSLYGRYNKRLEDLDITKGKSGDHCKGNEGGEGTWWFGDDAKRAGRYVCYMDREGTAWYEWTNSYLHLYAIAGKRGTDLKALDQWWSDTTIGPQEAS